MTGSIKEPSVVEASDILLKIGALLGAGAFCFHSAQKFLQCEPAYSWISAVGPITFTLFSVVLAGRILIFRLFAAYWTSSSKTYVRFLIKGTIVILLLPPMLSTATVFSGLLLPNVEDSCPIYTIYWPNFLPK